MFLSKKALVKMGFQRIGNNVLISDKASIYGADRISIGNNVRIDDFCILSAGKEIAIGSWVHIACYTSLIGAGLIELEDFSGISMKCTVLSSNADYSGEYMTNPQIAEKYLNTTEAAVVFERHSLVGAGSIILPGVSIGTGAVVGAMSLVKSSVPEFQIWAGNPLRFIKERKTDILKLEKQLLHG